MDPAVVPGANQQRPSLVGRDRRLASHGPDEHVLGIEPIDNPDIVLRDAADKRARGSEPDLLVHSTRQPSSLRQRSDRRKHGLIRRRARAHAEPI